MIEGVAQLSMHLRPMSYCFCSCLALVGEGLSAFSLLRHSPQSSLNPISDTPRQFVGPLVYRLVRDAYCLGSGGYGPAQQFDGFGFEHELLNHSSIESVNFCSNFCV